MDQGEVAVQAAGQDPAPELLGIRQDGLHDLLRRLIDKKMIIALESDSDLLFDCHFVCLLLKFSLAVPPL